MDGSDGSDGSGGSSVVLDHAGAGTDLGALGLGEVDKYMDLYRSKRFARAYLYWLRELDGPTIKGPEEAKALLKTIRLNDNGLAWAAVATAFFEVEQDYFWVTNQDLEHIRVVGPIQPGSEESRQIFREYADHYPELRTKAEAAQATARRVAGLVRPHIFISIFVDSAKDMAQRACTMLTRTCDILEAELERAEGKFWRLPSYTRTVRVRDAATRAAERTRATSIRPKGACPRAARPRGCRRTNDHDGCPICMSIPRTWGAAAPQSDFDEEEPEPVQAHIVPFPGPRARKRGSVVVLTDCCNAHICVNCAWKWVFERRNLSCPRCRSAF